MAIGCRAAQPAGRSGLSISGLLKRLEGEGRQSSPEEQPLKFICFGYLDTQKWGTLSADQQNATIDACFAYDEVLKKNGHRAGGEGLQGPQSARTLRMQSGKVKVTDGPYAESKELLGGLLILEARDLDHAVQLISSHPGMNMGPWEIRPSEDLTPMIRESEQRRAAAAGK